MTTIYGFLSISTPSFTTANCLIIAVNWSRFGLSFKYFVNCLMQSFVVAPGVFLSHSITVFASTGGPSAGAVDFRFLVMEGVCPLSSVAFRFLFPFPGVTEPDATGLPPRLPAAGLVARLEGPPFCPPP